MIPKKHIQSLITVQTNELGIMTELFEVIKDVATQINENYGACTISTNIGQYQSNKYMHWHVYYGDRIRD